MKLSYQRYENIKKVIAEYLEDYDVKKIPIDVFELAKKMNIKIIFASHLLEKCPNKVNEYMLFQYPHSYLIYNDEIKQFIIYIDDVGTKIKRQRFSLAHELMHIILGHQEQNDINESEANFGATYLLAPTSLTLLLDDKNILFNPEIVKEIFDVSIQAAEIVARYNQKRVQYSSSKETDYEKIINRLLKESFNQKIEYFANIKNLHQSQ